LELKKSNNLQFATEGVVVELIIFFFWKFKLDQLVLVETQQLGPFLSSLHANCIDELSAYNMHGLDTLACSSMSIREN